MSDLVTSSPDVLAASSPDSRRQLEALLEVNEAIAQHRDLQALFRDLRERLRAVVQFDFLALVLHDPARNVMRLHVLEAHHPTEKVTGTELPVEGTPSGWVWQSQQTFVVADTTQDTRFPEFMQHLNREGVRSIAWLPLTTAQRRIGALAFGRQAPECITDAELQFMQRVASQVAVAVDNALKFATSQAYQQQLARERDRLRVLLDINNVLVTSREFPELFRGIVSALERVVHHDYTSLALLDTATGMLKIHALDFPGHQGLLNRETTVPRDSSPSGQAIANGLPLLVRGAEFDRYSNEVIRVLRSEGVQTLCCVPLITHGRAFGTLNLAGRRADAFSPQDVELMRQVAAQIAIAVENALSFEEIETLKNKLAEEKLYLEEEISS